MDHIAAGRIPCHQIITAVASLEDAPAWLADLSGGATAQVKVLLRPDRDTAAGPGAWS